MSLKEGESCLSIPDTTVKVERYRSIKVKYTTIDGAVKEEKLEGFFAIVFQHEYDDLDGILITSKRV